MSGSRPSPAPLALALLLFAVVVAVPPVHATHEWGHRYMFYGRILNPDGEPAQNMILWASVKTTKPDTIPPDAKPYCIGNPCLPVQTDCEGLYYTYNPQLRDDVANALGLERTQASGSNESGFVMHIHNAELPSNAAFRLSTDYGNATGHVNKDLKFRGVDFTLDRPAPAAEACGDGDTWKRTYVVTGHIQIDDGSSRIDVMPHSHPGRQSEVTVTLQTQEGPKTQTSSTNAWADYRVVFRDVNVTEGATVSVEWNDIVKTRDVDLTYRVSAISIVESDSIARTALLVFAWVVGGLIVVGGAVWGIGKIRQGAEHRRVMGQGLRQRANK